MMTDSFLPTASSPTLAYLLTWVTQGTWSPGRRHGWTLGETQVTLAVSRGRNGAARSRAISLSLQQRERVEQAIRDCCETEQWNLIAANCRSNHAHAIVNATADPHEILRELQTTSSQQLNKTDLPRETWWEAGGNVRSLKKEAGLEAATFYVGVILQRM
ncbi:transposase [Blastopirellula sp. J2-11]|uniref:transposase n=1 Tax=Blastopirellula sp. J2-11 TaxID=2943192 RepID=UPI0021C8A7F5|nr:transposase [Blastopirellula sp. J2-11]UUO06872.1 transposase [Blastopirellula sp. J2-11]